MARWGVSQLDPSHGIRDSWQPGSAEYNAAQEQLRTRNRIRCVAGNRCVKEVLGDLMRDRALRLACHLFHPLGHGTFSSSSSVQDDHAPADF